MGKTLSCPKCKSPILVSRPTESSGDRSTRGPANAPQQPAGILDVIEVVDEDMPWAIPVSDNKPGPEDHIYVLVGKERKGPFVESQLRAMWNAGTLTANALYRCDGMADWKPLAELLEAKPSAAPERVTYNPKTGTFNGSLTSVMKLAIRAAQKLGYKIDNANESLGILTVQTGITWGSWSGALCSLSFQEVRVNTFQVVGTGKQNISGAQLLAIDLGEAKGRANRVIRRMAQLAD
jgi:hypothetical protein